MTNLLNLKHRRKTYDDIIDGARQKGFISMVFASQEYTLKEADKFLQEYDTIKKASFDQERKLTQFAKTIEHDLKLETVVGLRVEPKLDATAAVTSLLDMGINVHMLSGDTYDNCIKSAKVLNLCRGEVATEVVNLDFDDESIAQTEIRRAITKIQDAVGGKTDNKDNFQNLTINLQSGNLRTRSEIKNEIDKKPTKILQLSISGKSVDFLNKHLDYLSQFKFILQFCHSIFGYSMSSENKLQIVKIINGMNRVTLAIGSNYNDIKMLRGANVGVQLAEPEIDYQFGDILVDNLISIPTAMNAHCRNWNSNLAISVNSIITYSVTLLFCNMFFEIYSEFSSVPIFDSLHIVLGMLFIALSSVCFIFLNSPLSVNQRTKWPGFYCEKDYMNKLKEVKVLFTDIIPISIAQAAVFIFVSVHSLSAQVASTGSLLTIHAVQISASLMSLCSFSYSLIFKSHVNKMSITMIIVLIAFLLILVLYLLYYKEIAEGIIQVSIGTMIYHPNWVLLNFISVVFVGYLQTIQWYWYLEKKYLPLIYHFSEVTRLKLKGQHIDSLQEHEDQVFANRYKLYPTFTSMFLSSFAGQESSRGVI